MRLALVAVLLVACSSKSADKGADSVHAPGHPVVGANAVTDPAQAMTTFTQNGFLLAGAEYWPYTGTAEIKYPDEVLWGFYPKQGVVAPGEATPNAADARPEAVACATRAYAALQSFLDKPHPKLVEIIELGKISGDVVPRFYLWTNDYGRAATPYPPGVREARLWYWKRKTPEPPKPPGYWKWESTLTQSGECQIPSSEQIESFLGEMLASMKKKPQ
jgi:hypothetical protein